VTLVVFNRMQQDAGFINLRQLQKGYRKLGLTLDEAALSLIDGTVTQMKLGLDVSKPEPEFKETLSRVVGSLETVIDKAFLKYSGRIFPRNGQAAQRAEASGLDKFLKDTIPP
jgi:hypothetical protein